MKDKVHIKYVKKARQWCKTIFLVDDKTGKVEQKQEWSNEKPK